MLQLKTSSAGRHFLMFIALTIGATLGFTCIAAGQENFRILTEGEVTVTLDPAEFAVKFKPGISESRIAELNSTHDISVSGVLEVDNIGIAGVS